MTCSDSKRTDPTGTGHLVGLEAPSNLLFDLEQVNSPLKTLSYVPLSGLLLCFLSSPRSDVKPPLLLF